MGISGAEIDWLQLEKSAIESKDTTGPICKSPTNVSLRDDFQLLVHYVVGEIFLWHLSPKPVSGQCDKRMLLDFNDWPARTYRQ